MPQSEGTVQHGGGMVTLYPPGKARRQLLTLYPHGEAHSSVEVGKEAAAHIVAT